MASRLYKMTGIPNNIKRAVSSSVSRTCKADQSDAPGTVKRALLIAMCDPKGEMGIGYTVRYGTRIILSVGAAQRKSMGRALIARTHFEKDHYIIAARGHMHPTTKQQTVLEDHYTWSAKLGTAEYMVSQYEEKDANPMRFVNSSQGYGRANAKLVWIAGMRVPLLMATRHISPGQEILVDYPLGYT